MYVYGMAVLHSRLEPDGRTPADPALWTPVVVDEREGPAPSTTVSRWDGDEVELLVKDQRSVLVSRALDGGAHHVVVTSPVPMRRDLIVHPTLSFVANPVSRWLGRTVLHAGAVVIGGRAWIFMAESSGGKSTLAAELDRAGHPVLSDDMVVIADGLVFCGPRGSDLRADAVTATSARADLIVTPSRDRWRTVLSPAPLTAPIGGFVHLVWGDEVAATRLGVADRLSVLAASEAFGLGPARPTSFIDIVGHPFFRLSRPQQWSRMSECIAMLEALARR